MLFFPSCKVIGMSPRLSDVDLNGSCIGFCVCCFFCQRGENLSFFNMGLLYVFQHYLTLEPRTHGSKRTKTKNTAKYSSLGVIMGHLL